MDLTAALFYGKVWDASVAQTCRLIDSRSFFFFLGGGYHHFCSLEDDSKPKQSGNKAAHHNNTATAGTQRRDWPHLVRRPKLTGLKNRFFFTTLVQLQRFNCSGTRVFLLVHCCWLWICVSGTQMMNSSLRLSAFQRNQRCFLRCSHQDDTEHAPKQLILSV